MARTKTAQRQAEQRDHQDMMAAAADERQRMNRAISAGRTVSISTFLGPRQVKRITDDWWYRDTQGRSWAGCNDGDWADMMRQAGIPRNRRWEQLA